MILGPSSYFLVEWFHCSVSNQCNSSESPNPRRILALRDINQCRRCLWDRDSNWKRLSGATRWCLIFCRTKYLLAIDSNCHPSPTGDITWSKSSIERESVPADPGGIREGVPDIWLSRTCQKIGIRSKYTNAINHLGAQFGIRSISVPETDQQDCQLVQPSVDQFQSIGVGSKMAEMVWFDVTLLNV